MIPSTTISVCQVAGGPICFASRSGQRVFELLKHAIEAGRSVNLSFKNVTHLGPPFLNAAIGQLYGSFEEDKIWAHVKVIEIDQSDHELLTTVIGIAKMYFRNKEGFDKAIRDELEEL